MSKPWNKLIVALDVTDKRKVQKIIKELRPKVKYFKVGPIAYFRMGSDMLKWINRSGAKVFLDFKLYDIPNTMLETAKNFIDMGVWAFTVHTKSGVEALAYLKKGLAKEARRKKKKAPLIIGVTELTSCKASAFQVLKLAKLAKKAGIDGVVCSVWEARKIKKELGLCTITPGIRKHKTDDDQKRVATVVDAVREGSNYFVVGRPIVQQRDHLLAAQDLLSG